MRKVHDNDKLRDVPWRILFVSKAAPYNPDDISVSDAEMYGLERKHVGCIQVTDHIFEIHLYNFTESGTYFFLISNDFRALDLCKRYYIGSTAIQSNKRWTIFKKMAILLNLY